MSEDHRPLVRRLFEPAAARAIRLVDEVVAPERFEQRVLERAAEMATASVEAFAQIKRAWVRPVIEAIERTDATETEPWLDTWFSAEGQRRLRAAVARITKQ